MVTLQKVNLKRYLYLLNCRLIFTFWFQFVSNFSFLEPLGPLETEQLGDRINRDDIEKFFKSWKTRFSRFKNAADTHTGHVWISWHFLAPAICGQCNKMVSEKLKRNNYLFTHKVMDEAWHSLHKMFNGRSWGVWPQYLFGMCQKKFYRFKLSRSQKRWTNSNTRFKKPRTYD